MWKRSLTVLAAGLLGIAVGVPAFTQAPAPLTPVPQAPAAVVPATPTGVGALNKADADAWLDGFMPYALARGDVAGAVVVIVKDGQVLTQRGFGYADVAKRKQVDPATTLFRPGSVSKLYTWTAVMQQVEAGKLNLDADVNQYLDFKIPAYEGKPVTLRNIMTHTAGFEEIIKGLLSFDKPVPSLGDVVKRRIPERIYAPGTTPAYSNYATALAGYIVERVSGMSFDDYVDRNIFGRLGMQYSTFRQPLPARLKPFMSQGYELGSGDAQKYEEIGMAPAGSAAISGGDMAKFMIAHLNKGGPLLSPATAAQMYAPQHSDIPAINGMALGFYEQRINGRRSISHGGDTVYFHSDLWIFPEDNVGLYVSMNSNGKDGVARVLRGRLFEEFADRYLPDANKKPPVELPTAKEHAKLLVGTWTNSRRIDSSFAKVIGLIGDTKVSLDKDGRPVIPALTSPGGAPRKLIEVEPFVWQDAYGHERLAAQVVDGKVVRWSFGEVSPFMVWYRTPGALDSAWLMPALLFGVGVVLLTALSWPVGWFTRRRYGAQLALQGESLRTFRAVRGFAWLTLAALVGWMIVITGLEDFESHGSTDGLILLVQILGTLAFFGLFGLSVWNAWLTWKEKRSWFARVWSVLLVLAAFFILWMALAYRLVGFGTEF
ncbi:serine hydrolase domain-containing protein [Sphingomonas sp. DG1-23]|uniref:serine hydrolase domain-containing protein n=1 Tax=Sphingomonas sp. DG1-23 TaxID=3068316 RepID=UPI00273EF623|nr:serine hydrolase domain-containing protein [Sphingomonas sp. DG1-23]MDP5278909.1 serine hydrolase domain-containing protein [Sphingomonas sp. DG1-23]